MLLKNLPDYGTLYKWCENSKHAGLRTNARSLQYYKITVLLEVT